MNAGQIHRFRDSVAASLGNGQTVYMTSGEARALARALIRAARSVESEPFHLSAGITAALGFSDWLRSGEHMPELERGPDGRALRIRKPAARKSGFAASQGSGS